MEDGTSIDQQRQSVKQVEDGETWLMNRKYHSTTSSRQSNEHKTVRTHVSNTRWKLYSHYSHYRFKLQAKVYLTETSSTSHRRNVCLGQCVPPLILVWSWSWSLTTHLENLFSNDNPHYEDLWQVSLKSVHWLQRYRVTRNRVKCEIGLNGRTTYDRKT